MLLKGWRPLQKDFLSFLTLLHSLLSSLSSLSLTLYLKYFVNYWNWFNNCVSIFSHDFPMFGCLCNLKITCMDIYSHSGYVEHYRLYMYFNEVLKHPKNKSNANICTINSVIFIYNNVKCVLFILWSNIVQTNAMIRMWMFRVSFC